MKELSAAFIKAWGEFQEPKRTAKAYNYMYAPMDEVIKATKSSLVKHGLAVLQFPVSEDNGFVGVETILLHESGESLRREFYIQPSKNDPQSLGSLFTYLRRYAYLAICQIAPEDDDGASAMPSKPAIGGKQINTPAQTQQILSNSDNPADWIIPFGKKHKGKRLGDVPQQELFGFIDWLEQSAISSGKPIDGGAKELIEKAEKLYSK